MGLFLCSLYMNRVGMGWGERSGLDFGECVSHHSLSLDYTFYLVVVQSRSYIHLFSTPWTNARLLCPPLSPGVCSNSRPLSQ